MRAMVVKRTLVTLLTDIITRREQDAHISTDAALPPCRTLRLRPFHLRVVMWRTT